MKFDEERKYYVYAWFYKDSGKVFYIGKGSKYRYRSRKRDNPKLVEIINNNDCDSKILIGNLSEEEAFEAEKEQIEYYRKNNHPLINIQDGGHKPPSTEGIKRSEETKNKMSSSMKEYYSKNPEKKEEISFRMKQYFQTDEGKEFRRKSLESRRTEEFRKAQSERSRKANNTQEYIEKQSEIIKEMWKSDSYREAHSGKNNCRSQTVQQFDLDGNFISEYETVTIASKKTGVCHSKICAVARGDRKTAGGYIWKYPNPKNLSIKNTKKEYNVLNDKNAKGIVKCDLGGNELEEYNSIAEASRINNCERTNIIANLKKRTKSAYGYIWKYK